MRGRVAYPLWMNSMPECDSCGLCCDMVGITHDEYWAIKTWCGVEHITWKPRKDAMCGFLGKDNRCRIYEVRPLVCRIYGIVTQAPCPYHPEAARFSYSLEDVRRDGLGGFDAELLEAVSQEQIKTTYGLGVERKRKGVQT